MLTTSSESDMIQLQGGNNMAKPKQTMVRMSVSMPIELKESLEKEAAEKGTNFSNLVRMILMEREKDKK